jgi:hypothetical protein
MRLAASIARREIGFRQAARRAVCALGHTHS